MLPTCRAGDGLGDTSAKVHHHLQHPAAAEAHIAHVARPRQVANLVSYNNSDVRAVYVAAGADGVQRPQSLKRACSQGAAGLW
jgi:hypothetical protein